MNQISSKKAIVLIAGLVATLLVIAAASLFIQREEDTIRTTFQYDNISNFQVDLYRLDKKQSDKQTKIATIETKKEYRLHKKTRYLLHAHGADIASQKITIETGSEPSLDVTIPIELSKNKLESALTAERNSIIKGASSSLAGYLGRYRIQEDHIRLAYDSTWAIVPLEYTGTDVLQRDTLFAIFHKENHTWQQKTQPHIAVSKLNYPSIPDAAILKAAPTKPPRK